MDDQIELSRPRRSTLERFESNGEPVFESPVNFEEQCFTALEKVDFAQHLFPDRNDENAQDWRDQFVEHIRYAKSEISVLYDVISMLCQDENGLVLQSAVLERRMPHEMADDTLPTYGLRKDQMRKMAEKFEGEHARLKATLSKEQEWYQYLENQRLIGRNIGFNAATRSYNVDISYERAGSEYPSRIVVELKPPDGLLPTRTEIARHGDQSAPQRLSVEFFGSDLGPEWGEPKYQRSTFPDGLEQERHGIFDEEVFNTALEQLPDTNYLTSIVNDSCVDVEISPELTMRISLGEQGCESFLGRLSRIHLQSDLCLRHQINQNMDHVPDFEPIENIHGIESLISWIRKLAQENQGEVCGLQSLENGVV